jgi:hypothetical protein
MPEKPSLSAGLLVRSEDDDGSRRLHGTTSCRRLRGTQPSRSLMSI